MKYKLLKKALLSSLLLISIGGANAGQTVKNFDLYQSNSISGRMSSLSWVDKNKQPFANYTVPLSIEEGIPAQFYLAEYGNAEDPKSANTYADLGVVDADKDKKDDIKVRGNRTSANGGASCKFEVSKVTNIIDNVAYEGNVLFCPVEFTATKTAPLGVQRYALYGPAAGITSAVDIITSSDQGINVLPYTESGTIEVVAADARPNKISALAVSKNAADDKIKIHFNISGATGIQQAFLKFKSRNKDIADLSSDACQININSDGKGFCETTLTPQKAGETTIDLSGSEYLRKSGERLSYRYLPLVEVNIGSLYAGYMNGAVQSKSSKQVLEANSPVRSLAVNAKHDILYAISGTGVYTQKKPQTGLTLKKTITIGSDINRLQVLSLSNTVNELLVGNGFGQFYKVIGSNATLLSTDESKFASIISSYIDQTDNTAYLTDDKNNLGVYKQGKLSKLSNLLPSGQSNMLVAANGNVVYISSNKYPPMIKASYLYKFVNNKLEAVAIDAASNPFLNAKITNLFFADMDAARTDLYASSQDGKIYRLDRTATPNKWVLRATLASNSQIGDVVVDNLRNIYLTSGQKVWRIKHGETQAQELSNYTTDANPVSLVVNANDGIPLLETMTLTKADTEYTSKDYEGLHTGQISVAGVWVPIQQQLVPYFVVAPWMNANPESNPLVAADKKGELYNDTAKKSFIVKVTNLDTRQDFDVVVDGFIKHGCAGGTSDAIYAMHTRNMCRLVDTKLTTKIIPAKNEHLPQGRYQGNTDLLVKGWDWNTNDNVGQIKVVVDWTKN